MRFPLEPHSSKSRHKVKIIRLRIVSMIAVLSLACGETQVLNTAAQLDAQWLAELTRQSPCALVKIPYTLSSGISDQQLACVLTSAALRVIVDSAAVSHGIAPHVAASVVRADVTGGVVAPLLEGDPEWAWWIVYLQSTVIDAPLEVHFDRVTREITAGVCSECKPHGQ